VVLVAEETSLQHAVAVEATAETMKSGNRAVASPRLGKACVR